MNGSMSVTDIKLFKLKTDFITRVGENNIQIYKKYFI